MLEAHLNLLEVSILQLFGWYEAMMDFMSIYTKALKVQFSRKRIAFGTRLFPAPAVIIIALI